MTRIGIALLLAVIALPSCSTSGSGDARSEETSGAGTRPNVIVILADDLGLGDVQPTNPDCRIATPHLARMAAEGLTFLDAHSPSAVCTPTRYGLLTGRYSWRSRLARGVLDGRSDHLIPAERETVGHLMRRAGYRTAMIGKWHLGWDWTRKDGAIDFSAPVTSGPDANGFERYFAHPASLDMPPYVWVDTGRVTALPDREEGVARKDDRYGWYRRGPVGADFRIEDTLPRIFSEAEDYIRNHAAASRAGAPFFLYVALPAPHTPIVPITPFAGASGINPYADFVQQTDDHVGALLSTLEEAGIGENTLVVFTSDNGCSPEANMPLLAQHGHHTAAGFRGHKADLYEGGHRVPLIARWPARIPAGGRTSALACLTDLHATLADLVNGEVPPRGGEDSHSWLPVFEGAPSSTRLTLVSHSVSGHFAFRRGPWKLLLAHGSGGWSAPREGPARRQGLGPVQLYRLDRDPGEKDDLAGKHPDVVAALTEALVDEVRRGRSTAGPDVPNDREITLESLGIPVANRR